MSTAHWHSVKFLIAVCNDCMLICALCLCIRTRVYAAINSVCSNVDSPWGEVLMIHMIMSHVLNTAKGFPLYLS